MSVLIGLIDQLIHANKQLGWDVNKIGGTPSWLVAPSSDNDKPMCKLCGKPSSLVCQLYCPLGGSLYHRCLYVFTCLSKCTRRREGWTVLRSMKYDATYNTDRAAEKLEATAAADDWLDDQDDWGQGSDDWGQESSDWGQESSDWGQESAVGEEEEAESRSRRLKDNWGEKMHVDMSTDVGQQSEGTKICPKETLDENCTKSVSVTPIFRGGVDRANLDESTTATEKDLVLHRVEMQSAALSQLHLSEKNISPSDKTKSDCGDCVLPSAEDDRWSAVVGLLNTRRRQDSEASDGSNPSPQTPIALKSFYLSVIEEPHKESHDISGHVTELMQTYERTEGVSLSSLELESAKSKGGKGTEHYERTELKHGDKVFHKFMKRLQRCPEQCVRYERSGSPLLMSEYDGSLLSPCSQCGGGRVFELQLLSPLIPWLQTQDDTNAPVDFGTVLVFTCKENCWSDGCHLVEEEIVLQADPDQHLYR